MIKHEEFERHAARVSAAKCHIVEGGQAIAFADYCLAHMQCADECDEGKSRRWLACFVLENRDLIARALRRDAEIEKPSTEALQAIAYETGESKPLSHAPAVLGAFKRAVK
jgi:hypothetical protein